MVRCSTVLLILSATAAATGYASLAPWLEPLPRTLPPVALIWLLWRRGRGGVIPSRPALLLALFLFGYFLLSVPRQGVVTPSVGFMTSLLALRLVAEKSSRHHLQICALAIFLLAASSIYSLSPLFLLYLLILLLTITLLLLLLSFAHYDQDMPLDRDILRRLITSGIAMQVCAVPLIILFFLILPRTQVPLWRFGAPVESSRVGFSETVRPGSSTSVTMERIPVFRAEMPRVSDEHLYWRGTVLNRVEGGTWSRVVPPSAGPLQRPTGQTTGQMIQLEPGAGTFLFTLDAPLTVRRVRAALQADGVVLTPVSVTRRIRYEVLSARYPYRSEVRPEFYLQTPQAVSPRMLELASNVRREGVAIQERPVLLEQRFRQMGLVYDTRGLPTTADPLDTFLFSSKRGNCEFFAASYALLLRLAGVPARLVGGYYGGVYNELGGYYLVTQDMAHTWVEYYLEGEGWRRVDPTLWGEGFSGLVESRARGTARMRLYADAFTFFWNGRIIPFDVESQFQVLKQTGDLFTELRGRLRLITPVHLAALTSSAVLAFLFWSAFRRRTGVGRRRERLLLDAFEKRLRKKHPDLRPLGERGIFGLAADSGSEAALRFAERYGRLVYRDMPLSSQDMRDLKQLLKEL